MADEFHIVVCGSLVPDPLQTLEPVSGPQGPMLKNEQMLPAVLDPWAGHALFEAANLAANNPGSKVWLVSIGPKAKLQQLMMTVAQKVPFELVVLDGSASGFTDAEDVATSLAQGIEGIATLDKSKMLLFGGCASASRDGGVTMSIVGEKLGIQEQFLAVDKLEATAGELHILERVEGGQYQSSVCKGTPAVLAWATGSLPEPPNNPQVGMMNMRTIMPSLQQAKTVTVSNGDVAFEDVALPSQRRETRVVKDTPVEEIADEIVEWLQN